jgi:hypothetical protein
MRASSAVLTDTSVRLWDLVFPADRALLGRTRSAYVHLDNLIAFSKRDRDGKVDAYLACYLPDEVAVLFFAKGDVVNAAMYTSVGRFPAAISEALRHIRSEPERAEITFATAGTGQLASMFASCEQAPLDIPFDVTSPESVFRPLLERRFTGLVEIIAGSGVNYLMVKDGRFQCGYFADRREGEAPTATVARLFTGSAGAPRPRLTVKAFAGATDLKQQAPPAMLAMFRHYVWDLTDLAEREMPGDGAKRAERARTRLLGQHEVLRVMGGPRDADHADPIIEPAALAASMAAWTAEFLGELEVIRPQIAPQLLRGAAREHRYALAAVKFFDRLPWRVQW